MSDSESKPTSEIVADVEKVTGEVATKATEVVSDAATSTKNIVIGNPDSHEPSLNQIVEDGIKLADDVAEKTVVMTASAMDSAGAAISDMFAGADDDSKK